jgi:hypothetical protein
MSGGNEFEANTFVDNRVGFMVAADQAANCTAPDFVPNRARANRFAGGPREDPLPSTFGRCLLFTAPVPPG